MAIDAVPLFFILSGYIFFAVYSERIVEKKIDAREFFILRILAAVSVAFRDAVHGRDPSTHMPA